MSMSAAEIRFVNQRAAESETLSPAWKAQTYRLIDEVIRLRQGLWECARISGADISDDTPDALTYPDIVEFTKREVQELRDDYDSIPVCLHQPEHKLECQ